MTHPEKNKSKSWQRALIEWGIISAVALTLYATGLHTEVIGTLQRGMLWTGLFDAETSQIATKDGPKLSDNAFNVSLQASDGTSVSLSDFKDNVIFNAFSG